MKDLSIAMDLFVVPTVSFWLLYGLLIMEHGRRQILWLGVTAHPTAEWIANQLTQACGWERAPTYLIRDRDACYGHVFTRRLRSLGIRDRPTSPRSPWQNCYAERLIGSIRRDCLDHVVVFGERHLRHVLSCYMEYYNAGAHASGPWQGHTDRTRRPISWAYPIPTCSRGPAPPICTNLIYDKDSYPGQLSETQISIWGLGVTGKKRAGKSRGGDGHFSAKYFVATAATSFAFCSSSFLKYLISLP